MSVSCFAMAVAVLDFESSLCFRDFRSRSPPFSWEDFLVATCARHLVVLVGPAETLDIQWQAAFDKHWFRVVQLAASAPGPSVAIKLYNTCAITVLPCLAQHFPFPVSFLRHERGTLHEIMRAPPNSWCLVDLPGARSCSHSSSPLSFNPAVY